MLIKNKLYSVIFGIFLLFQFAAKSAEHVKVADHRNISISAINVDVGDVSLFDPPFYLIETDDGKLIYILGAMHPLPVTKALSSKAYQELDRIAKSHPIFITEHSSSNEVNLSMIPEAQTDEKWINSHLIGHAERVLFEKIKEEHLSIDMDTKSTTPVKTLETVNPWLALPILTMHIGSYLKREFSSFEHSILTIWGNNLLPELYLEDHKETLSILKSTAVQKYNYYVGGISYFLNLLLTATNYNTDLESKKFWKSKFIEYITNYSFKDFVKEERDTPTIERNHAWISTFLEKYHQKGANFLIVVGMAHLEGPDNFIHLLLHKIKIKGKIKRFSNEEGWKDFL